MASKIAQLALSLVCSLALLASPLAADQFVAQAQAPRKPVTADLFGMHFHHVGGTTPWPDVPVAQWRLWDAYVAWPNLQPAKNRWDFKTLDAYIQLAQEHHAALLLPLGLSPAWASARPEEKSVYRPGYAAEPRDMEDWRTYVRTVVRHCAGKVQAYEIWNEPNLKQFWTGSVDQMLQLTREAALIIRSVDPQAIIVSPSATQDRGLPWLQEFLRKGGAEYVDVIGYHLYVAPQPPEATVALASSIRRIMQSAGAAEKPLWNTEVGWFLPKPFPPDLAAAYLVRDFILNWASGVDRIYWYAWDNHGWVSLETTAADSSTLTAAGKAYAAAARWLVGRTLANCSADAAKTWTCTLSGTGPPAWIVWNASGDRTFALPADWRANFAETLAGQKTPIADGRLSIGQEPILLSAAS
jgi:hypothetical protein